MCCVCRFQEKYRKQRKRWRNWKKKPRNRSMVWLMKCHVTHSSNVVFPWIAQLIFLVRDENPYWKKVKTRTDRDICIIDSPYIRTTLCGYFVSATTRCKETWRFGHFQFCTFSLSITDDRWKVFCTWSRTITNDLRRWYKTSCTWRCFYLLNMISFRVRQEKRMEIQTLNLV